ncbi:MAG: anti-sigma factor [Bryobacterales bacterium]|nr:anti-sigma factor [Bryobacterales bacterium]MBV9401126.1 anti-sigma factor [Bryobacterales bacterium]
MTCEDLKDGFELYSLGLCDAEERSEIAAHLERGCDTCQKNLRGALALNAAMFASAPSVRPRRRLRRRVVEGFGVRKAGWGWLWALAAACMAAIAVWLSIQERRRTTELAEIRQNLIEVSSERDRLAQAFNFFNQPGTRQVNFGSAQPRPPRGNVFVNSRLGVLLIAGNLPPLGPGRTYEMWVIPKGGAPVPAGLFQSAGDGSAMHLLNGPMDVASLGAVAVSVEPQAGSRAPTTTPIIVAAL